MRGSSNRITVVESSCLSYFLNQVTANQGDYHQRLASFSDDLRLHSPTVSYGVSDDSDAYSMSFHPFQIETYSLKHGDELSREDRPSSWATAAVVGCHSSERLMSWWPSADVQQVESVASTWNPSCRGRIWTTTNSAATWHTFLPSTSLDPPWVRAPSLAAAKNPEVCDVFRWNMAATESWIARNTKEIWSIMKRFWSIVLMDSYQL